jgi:hypothetical protein
MGFLLQANSTGMVWKTTGTMKHVLCDTVMELRMEDRVRDLSMDNGIDMVGVTNFVCRLQEDEEVYVRQATLLELNGVDTSSDFTKQTTSDIMQQSLLLLVEDTGNNVRTICSSLTCSILILQEGSLDLRPIWVCSHGDEEVRFGAITTDCHGVLEELIHVACASLV